MIFSLLMRWRAGARTQLCFCVQAMLVWCAYSVSLPGLGSACSDGDVMGACKSTGSEQQRALLQMDSKLKSKHTSQFKNNPTESQYLGEDLNSAVAGDTLITNWKSRAVVSSATRAFNESVRNARKLWKSVDLHSIDSDSNVTDYEELDDEPIAVPKVAFLFMVLNHMENEDIWDSF